MASTLQFESPNADWYSSEYDYPSTTRPDGVLTVAVFARHQRQLAPQLLQALIEECWRRYAYACALTGVLLDPDTPSPIRQLPDLTPLLYPWDRLCCWYREMVFGRQLDLFECPYGVELARWYEFIEIRCFSQIYIYPERVGRLLTTVGLGGRNLSQWASNEDLSDGEDEPLFGWVPNNNF